MIDRISKVIKEAVGCDGETAAQTRLGDLRINGLPLDSLDQTTALVALEEEFDIYIPDDKFVETTTLGEVARLVERLVNKSAIVGNSNAFGYISCDADEQGTRVVKIMVYPEYRGHGHGSALLQGVCHDADKHR